MNDTFSNNDYRKYQNSNRKNPAYNKLFNDIGYPQEILVHDLTMASNKNYVKENKKNLKNFFKERLPVN